MLIMYCKEITWGLKKNYFAVKNLSMSQEYSADQMWFERSIFIAKQTSHIKCQDLFSLKKKKKNKTFRMSSAPNFA